MPTPATHLPDTGSGLARTLRDLIERVRRLEGGARRSLPVAWQDLTLAADWTPAAGTWQLPQVSQDPYGAVQLRGSIAPGTLTAGTAIAILPDGWAPPWDLEWRVGGGAPTAHVDLTVTQTGAVTIQGTTGTITRISLTSIRIPAII